jgi:protoheme IX farnesyltransferase
MVEVINNRSYIQTKARAYFDLTKFRLSITVVFSAGFGYYLGVSEMNWGLLALFCLASFTTTAAANIINQIIEKDLDKLMNRTKNRPLPSGRLSVNEVMVFGFVMASISILILFSFFSWKAAGLAMLSMLLYGLPGAFPPMIGWVAATGHFGLEPGILFAIQFFWQFPHFWAIAWVTHEDYTRAGFRLLPSKGGQDLNSAIQMMSYTLFLLPLCWVPYYLGMTGVNSAVFAMIMGVLFLAQTFQLMRKVNRKAALQLMFGSFIYLPFVQIGYLIDKV